MGKCVCGHLRGHHICGKYPSERGLNNGNKWGRCLKCKCRGFVYKGEEKKDALLYGRNKRGKVILKKEVDKNG